uniref:Nucleolin n=2 Tax=Nothobranchius rachovii TaxID=451742 RepID=A0A1A8NDY8_9TELE
MAKRSRAKRGENNKNPNVDGEDTAADPQMSGSIQVKRKMPTVSVSWEDEKVCDDADQTSLTVKRELEQALKIPEADPDTERSPSKKTKLLNDGFCLYVGNLNRSKNSQELKDSIANYFVTNGLLFHDIRVDRYRKHAFVDMSSKLDLTKALTLNGETILDMPMKLAQAKVRSDKKENVKSPELRRKVKDGRCLFLKNLPYNTTKQDILKVFRKAIAVRFPGGTSSPSRGIAFVQFQNQTIATKVLKKKQHIKFQGRDLVVDRVGERGAPAAEADSSSTQAAPAGNTLFVSRLPKSVTEKQLKKVFKKAVGISLKVKDKQTRYAFVEFLTVADAEKALQSSKDVKISKQAVRVEMRHRRRKPEVSSKTLFVVGLAATTSAETLQSVFEGAVDARVVVDKDTGTSKRFGFVEFDNEESCKAAKGTMEDCEIDGSKVTVDYAHSKTQTGHRATGVGPPSG